MSVELNPSQKILLQKLVDAKGAAPILKLGNCSRGDIQYLQNKNLIAVPTISKGKWIQITDSGREALGAPLPAPEPTRVVTSAPVLPPQVSPQPPQKPMVPSAKLSDIPQWRPSVPLHPASVIDPFDPFMDIK